MAHRITDTLDPVCSPLPDPIQGSSVSSVLSLWEDVDSSRGILMPLNRPGGQCMLLWPHFDAVQIVSRNLAPNSFRSTSSSSPEAAYCTPLHQ